MSSDAKAPLTSHVRKRQGTLRAISPTPPAGAATEETPAAFRSVGPFNWVRLPCHLTRAEQESNSPPPLKKRQMTREEISLCGILGSLCEEFTEQKRPFAALTARIAMRLIMEGRQDDINAGLWAHIARKEEEQRQKEGKLRN